MAILLFKAFNILPAHTTTMRYLLLLSLGLLPFIDLYGQETRSNTVVYHSFEEFRSDSGSIHLDHEGVLKWGFKFFYLFRAPDDDLVSYKEGTIWGFRWRDDVFRCAGPDGAVRLIEKGDVSLWRGKGLYISHGTDGDLLPLEKLHNRKFRARSKDQDAGTFGVLYDCLQACPDTQLARRCVKDFNGDLLGELK